MTDLRKVVIAKAMGAKANPSGDISDVEKKTKDMNIIDQAMETAKKLAGTEALTGEMKRKEDKLEEERERREKAEKEVAKKESELVEERLGGKIDKLAESVGKGASPQSITDQISDIKRVADELGLGGGKVSEFKAMADLIKGLSSQKSIVEQIKEAEELSAMLHPAKGKETLVEGVPAEVAIELKRMDTDLKITLEKMADERQDRAQNFTLTVKKWDEERETRRQEIDAKLVIERERNELLAGGLKTVGEAMGKGYAESKGEMAAPPGGISRGKTSGTQTYKLQAPEGESGEVDCPNCHTMVGIGPTSALAQCVGCNSKFTIERIPAAEGAAEPLPAEEGKVE